MEWKPEQRILLFRFNFARGFYLLYMSDQLRKRTNRFALDVMGLCSQLPRRFEVQHIYSQLLRSSSSVAANFRAAFRGRSKAEFIAKLGIAEEECDESQFWLEMLRDGLATLQLKVSDDRARNLEQLIAEANELLRIIIASRVTAKGRKEHLAP